ncbi:MAG: wax ester/triacylglycerol synthase family O-acyltransferase [Nitriliruptorales bacterium]|nr:wax ester/triacylglycerol synthase family O-acyltransferase [Nitriliruptorales bacterium]
MQLIAPTDAMFLLSEGRERPMHVGGLQLFRPPSDAGPDYASQLYRDALEHDVMPRLRRYPERTMFGLGPWRWEEDEALDLEYHLRHSALPTPGRVRELLALTSRLHGTLLDRSRPLWEAHIIEGLADGRFALYTKIHHALVDGVAAVKLLEHATSDDPDERDMPPPFAPRTSRRSRGGRGDGDGGLIGAARVARDTAVTAAHVTAESAKAALGASRAAIRTVARSFREQAATLPYRAPRSILNAPISGARRYAADAWPLEQLRSVGRELDGTVNDVVLAMCAGALRRYLIDLDALPAKPLVAMVPVSLRLRGGQDEDVDPETDTSGNAVGLILCNLGTHLEDPADRFALITRSMEEGKLTLEGLNELGVLVLSAISMSGVGLGILPFYDDVTLLQRPPFNVIISNVPGPKERRYWNGAEMEGLYPVSIPFDGQALNITVESYADRMGFGLIGCRRTVPHLQRLLEHLDTSLEELTDLANA